jgi:hypothetical protein
MDQARSPSTAPPGKENGMDVEVVLLRVQQDVDQDPSRRCDALGRLVSEFWWSGQREIAEMVVHNRYSAIKGSHDVSKSHTVSRLACWWIDVHPPGEAFVVTTALTTACRSDPLALHRQRSSQGSVARPHHP